MGIFDDEHQNQRVSCLRKPWWDIYCVGTEDGVIRESIKFSRYRDNIVLTIRHATTVHDLRRSLLDENFQIVHISGHGTGMGLVLKDEVGRQVCCPATSTGRFVQTYSPSFNALS